MDKINNKKYVIDNPALLSEWNYEKNNLLGYSPANISYGSAIKVWWICKENHEWEASPNHRSKGRRCPICAELNRSITRRKNIVIKRGSLFVNNPILAKQWHPTRNKPLTPNEFTVNSTKRIWWLCDKGHEWEASIHSRNSGAGCPICSGFQLLVGYNDLATRNPILAKQWHPTKNGDLKPTDVKIHEKTKVWWICDKGHEWKAAIFNRTSGNYCPICSSKTILVGYNDLATLMPAIASEWHPTKNGNLSPKDFAPYSNKKVWWKCKKGHEWITGIYHRTKGTGCPECFGETKSSFPEQVIFFYLSQITTTYNRYIVDKRTEIDVYLPEYKIGIEYDGKFYHSGIKAEEREKRKEQKLEKLGIHLIRVKEKIINEKENVIYSKPGANNIELAQTIIRLLDYLKIKFKINTDIDIDIARDRNKIYEAYIHNEKENSLAIKNPKLASEWHPTKNLGLTPEHVSYSSNKRVWWQCKYGHEWQAQINSRNQEVGCPVCSGHKVLIGFNDLQTINPSLASEWHPTKNGNLKPTDFVFGSNTKVWWLCKHGHEWKAQIVDRNNGRGCAICSGHKVLAGFNDLKTKNPALASEWHPTKNNNLKASNFTCGSDKKVWWLGKCGHEWQAVISSRNVGVGCPYCAGQKVLTGYNDLATVNPLLASEWHPTKNGNKKPTTIMPNTNKKAWWLGKCGHEWEADISSRNRGNNCPYCANQIILKGFNDLETTNPTLASEWHPTKNGNLTASDFMAGSNKKVWWQCKKGHEWKISPNIRSRGNNCPYCANQIVLKGYNDLATTNPTLALEWHPTKNKEVTPYDVMSGTNKKAWWLGKCGHEWEAVISSRNRGSNCPYCARKKVLKGFNDLVTTNPTFASEWHPTKNKELTPYDVMSGTNKKVWWLCKYGHEWESSPNQRSQGRKCPYCKQNTSKI